VKWYTAAETEHSIIISSRVRLARNLGKYPFSALLSEDGCREMISDIVTSIKNDRTPLSPLFEYINLDAATPLDVQSMLERHILSPMLVHSSSPKGVLVKDDESVCIMLGEEDHIRIQSIFAGDGIDSAWDLADKIDNIIEETLEYAFDKDFGYLTSCPTNTGTGLRASYMLHLPLLERTEQIKNLLQTLGKFGMTIRGIYGEGSDSQGGIYQVSNQLTLGKSEQEIIAALKNVTNQIIDAENSLRQKLAQLQRIAIEDRIYRSYGILANCRRLTVNEAMGLLSDIRLGLALGVFKSSPLKLGTYNVMMNIHPANLQKEAGAELSEEEALEKRAEYVRGIINPV